ncbi:MAG: chorismate pyruvate-lyase family protein [Minicystis sp.]
MRYCLSAGAPLAPPTAAAFGARFGVSARQLYGTTETGVVSINRGDGADAALGTVGFSIPGVTLRVLDDDGQPVAAGETGNIAIESLSAARGYDRPVAESESSFRDGAFLPGDVGRFDEAGRLQITGRRRFFINVGGNKVDPSEVEGVLRALPLVQEAVVVGVPDATGAETVKAVLVTSAPIERSAVLEHCRAHLAPHKIPRIVQFRAEIPRSPLGKVLRKYLIEDEPAPPAAGAASAPSFDARSGFQLSGARAAALPTDDLGLADVSPLLRALLVTDGTVTKLLEAFLWEPIQVDRLFQQDMPLDRDEPLLEATQGELVVKRRIVLRGVTSKRAYAYAETIVNLGNLGAGLREDLLKGRLGVGELLRDRRLETYRELCTVFRTEAGNRATPLGLAAKDPVIERRYVIFAGGRPALLIDETFPEHRFRDIVPPR